MLLILLLLHTTAGNYYYDDVTGILYLKQRYRNGSLGSQTGRPMLVEGEKFKVHLTYSPTLQGVFCLPGFRRGPLSFGRCRSLST